MGQFCYFCYLLQNFYTFPGFLTASSVNSRETDMLKSPVILVDVSVSYRTASFALYIWRMCFWVHSNSKSLCCPDTLAPFIVLRRPSLPLVVLALQSGSSAVMFPCVYMLLLLAPSLSLSTALLLDVFPTNNTVLGFAVFLELASKLFRPFT